MDKKLFIFKNFVEFLSIYGSENYGTSAEVDWDKVYGLIMGHSILDLNAELDNVLYKDFSSEEFRDAVFSYIEKQVLGGYPVWRLFKMSDWLNSKLEQGLAEQCRIQDEKDFKRYKCYHCKYYFDEVQILCEGMDGPAIITIEEYWATHTSLKHVNLIHPRRNCLKRKMLLEEEDTGKPFHHRLFEKKLPYSGFNRKDSYRGSWALEPRHIRKCPYFEESGITFSEFIDKNIEIS